MTAVVEVLWLGMLLGVGAALSVGPIFVVIIQQAATSGFGAALRVILGSATADLVLLLPALAFAWIIRSLDRGALWVGSLGALFLLYLAGQAARDAGTASSRPTAAGRSGKGSPATWPTPSPGRSGWPRAPRRCWRPRAPAARPGWCCSPPSGSWSPRAWRR